MSRRSQADLHQRAYWADAARFAWTNLWVHKTRTLLTALSMMVANASVILVVTVAATGRDFIVRQIEGVGSNLIYAYYEAGGNVSIAEADYITVADLEAVKNQLGAMARGVAGVMSTWDRLYLDGRARQVRVLGSTEDYQVVRNLDLPAGRFFGPDELAERRKVCLLTEPLAKRLFGSANGALGQRVQVHGISFQVIGVFNEGVETFGQSEVAEDSILIPLTVMKYFRSFERIDPLYVSVRDAGGVRAATNRIEEILVSRHRPGSLYRVENLSGMLSAAENITLALTVILIAVAAITLSISGVFIMNIMLIAVSERTREIGIRMSVGATRRQIRTQFLLEAIGISALGGLAGVLLGVTLPWVTESLLANLGGVASALGVRLPVEAERIASQLQIDVSVLAVAVALIVSAGVGAVFGLLPAARAAKLNPVEALRYE